MRAGPGTNEGTDDVVKKRWRTISSGAICAIVLTLVNQPPARAQETPQDVPSANDHPSAGSPADGAQQPGVEAVLEKQKKKPRKNGRKRPTVNIGENVSLTFTGRIESDVRMATPAIGLDAAGMQWQDRRVGVEGTAFKRFSFELSRELSEDFSPSPDHESAWKDAYVATRVAKGLTFDAGRFKLPFGREALTGETNLDFVYRSLAARVLSPGRDAGVMAEGRAFDRAIEYQAGYFTRDGEYARTSQTDGGESAIGGRVVVAPFAFGSDGPLAGLTVGVALMNSRLEDRLGIRGRTVLGDAIFFDRVYVNGRRQRTGFEAAWAGGPVSLSTEVISVSDQRQGMGFSGSDLPAVRAASWYVAGTWALTGERKRGRIEPAHELLRGGAGAVELAIRLERLRFDDVEYPGSQFGFPSDGKLLGNADRVLTLGINWYLDRYFKLQMNVMDEAIADPVRSPSSSPNGRFTSTVFRVQFRL
jgi:phosphate-selective porin OprO/OprP